MFNFPPIFKHHPTYNVQWSVKKKNTSFLCNCNWESRAKRSKSSNQRITADVSVSKLVIGRRKQDKKKMKKVELWIKLAIWRRKTRQKEKTCSIELSWPHLRIKLVISLEKRKTRRKAKRRPNWTVLTTEAQCEGERVILLQLYLLETTNMA